MRSLLTLLLAVVSLSLSAAQLPAKNIVSSSTIRIIDEADFARSYKLPDNEKYIKRVQIRNQAGLDGRVQRIHLNRDSEEDKPGIRAYGLPKKHLADNGAIERVLVQRDRVDDASRSRRLVEAYGMPKDDTSSNGFIERLPSSRLPDGQRGKPDSRNEDARAKRSVRQGSKNEIKSENPGEAEDMIAQDTKVFRPLFVYRQQIERRNHARRNTARRNHRHATHQPCYHGHY